MGGEGPSEPGKAERESRRRLSLPGIAAVLIIVAIGFGLGYAMSSGETTPDAAAAELSGEEKEALAAMASAESAESWSKGLRQGIDAGAMTGFQDGTEEGASAGTRAGYKKLQKQYGAINIRSETQNDLGYEPEQGDLVLSGAPTPAKYIALWAQMSPEDKAWAKKVSWCESGHDPTVLGLGGEYRGAFQYTMDAWRISPNSPGGDPIDYSWKVQAVVAVSLMHEMGTGPWPVCG
jgi:hypothetical protein